jgi:phage tail-like protein
MTTITMPALSTLLTDPVRNFKFVVSIYPNDQTSASALGPKFGRLGFVSVGGLSVTTEPIAYREGGYNTNVHQLPGQSSFTPLTLSKGIMLGNDQHWAWMKQLFSVFTGNATGSAGANFRCTVDIQVLSHPNPVMSNATSTGVAGVGAVGNVEEQHTSMFFRVYNAWITNVTYSGLDAGANSLMVEEMTLVHEGFEVIFGTGYTTAGDARNIAIASKIQ